MTNTRCPICKKFDASLPDFNIAYCPNCDFYWHFWMDEKEISKEVEEFLESKKKTGGYPKRFEGIFKLKF